MSNGGGGQVNERLPTFAPEHCPNCFCPGPDIAPDDRRFLVLVPPESGSEEPNTVHATILLNFFDELRRRLPTDK
jgi:hypothetical protein